MKLFNKAIKHFLLTLKKSLKIWTDVCHPDVIEFLKKVVTVTKSTYKLVLRLLALIF